MVTDEAYELLKLLCDKGPLTIKEITSQSSLNELDVKVAQEMFPYLILMSEDKYKAADAVKKQFSTKAND